MTGNRGRWPKIDEERGVEDVTLLILEWLGKQGVNACHDQDGRRLPVYRFTDPGGGVVAGFRLG